MKPHHRVLGCLIALAALILDQGSKSLLLYGLHFATMPPWHMIQVLPCFNLVMVWNPGITFGLFPAGSIHGTLALAAFQLIATILLLWWLWRTRSRLLAISIGLVVGGAIGNLIDRLIYGKVADFFHFYIGHFDWYVFNVADAAITIGVLGLLYDALTNPGTDKAGKE